MPEIRSKLKPNRKKKTEEAYVISMPSYESSHQDYELIRIILTERETRIDMGFRTLHKKLRHDFSLGKSQTFLDLQGLNKRLQMQDLSNYQTDPNVTWFFFTLHFPPIIKEVNFRFSSVFNHLPQQEVEHVNLTINGEQGLFFKNIALNDWGRLSMMNND